MTTNPLTVRLPNGQTMKSTHTALLYIPQLSKAEKAAHTFPAMEKNSLLSVGQFCDEVYSVVSSIDEVTILNATHKTII
jgi:deoxyxylulose-5-phosphate synthase